MPFVDGFEASSTVNEPPVGEDSQQVQAGHKDHGGMASVFDWIIRAIFKLKLMHRLAIKAERKLWELQGDASVTEWIETGHHHSWVPQGKWDPSSEADGWVLDEAAVGEQEDTATSTEEDTAAGTQEEITAST